MLSVILAIHLYILQFPVSVHLVSIVTTENKNTNVGGEKAAFSVHIKVMVGLLTFQVHDCL